MGWSIGFDDTWNRDIGYGVPAFCDHPDCSAEIDRGLSYVCCGEEPYGGRNGCGLYFCGKHHDYRGKCERCASRKKKPFAPKPDHPRWMTHKLWHASWAPWRRQHPKEVAAMREHLSTLPPACPKAGAQEPFESQPAPTSSTEDTPRPETPA